MLGCFVPSPDGGKPRRGNRSKTPSVLSPNRRRFRLGPKNKKEEEDETPSRYVGTPQFGDPSSSMPVVSGDVVVSSSSALSPLSPAQSSAPVDDEENVQLWDMKPEKSPEKSTASGGAECDRTTNVGGASKDEPESNSGTESEDDVGHDSDSDGIEYSEDRQVSNGPSIPVVSADAARDGKLQNPFDVHTPVDSVVVAGRVQLGQNEADDQKRSENGSSSSRRQVLLQLLDADEDNVQPVPEIQNMGIQIEEDEIVRSEEFATTEKEEESATVKAGAEPTSPRDDRNSFLRTSEGQKFKDIMLRGIEVNKYHRRGKGRAPERRVLSVNSAMTLLTLINPKKAQQTKHGRVDPNARMFPFIGLAVIEKGDTQLILRSEEGTFDDVILGCPTPRAQHLLVRFLSLAACGRSSNNASELRQL